MCGKCAKLRDVHLLEHPMARLAVNSLRGLEFQSQAAITHDVPCDMCHMPRIIGVRYMCTVDGTNLCSSCEYKCVLVYLCLCDVCRCLCLCLCL